MRTLAEYHLLVDVGASAEELRVADGIRQVRVEQVLTKSGRRFVGHLDTVLQYGYRKLNTNKTAPHPAPPPT